MKIFTKEQIYKGDKLTVKKQKITSTDLMERAGTEIFNWIDSKLEGEQVLIHVFCGIGNNGGDGLVLARHLILHGYNVKTYVINCSHKRSKDFLTNYERIKSITKNWPRLLNCTEDIPEIDDTDIIIDAIFGIGLNRPISDWLKSLFLYFEKTKAYKLSIDIPSGLYTDKPLADDDIVFSADLTFCLASPKLVLFLPDTGKHSTHWVVLDIGLDEEFLSTTETEANLIDKYAVLPMYIPRDKFSHKGQFGHALVIGGSYGKIGSVILASKAALSAGAGLVSSYVPKCGYIPLQSSFPEAMVITDTDNDYITAIDFNIKPTVIGFGVGIGTEAKTIKAFETFLNNNRTPLVIDADGINILSKKKRLLKLLPEQTILTPHPKELERLIGVWRNDFDKLKKVKSFSKKHNVIVVIKGANTMTVFLDKIYVNSTGNPGLASAGSGDVLTGIITGLLSQGYRPLDATIFGVYLHGKSADIAVENYGYQSLIASHIIEYLGEAYIDLFEEPELPQEESEY